MQNPSIAQWACMIGMIAVLIYPRLGSIKTAASALLAKAWPAKASTADTTDADRVAAFMVLLPSLTPEAASMVWKFIQPPSPPSAFPPKEVTP